MTLFLVPVEVTISLTTKFHSPTVTVRTPAQAVFWRPWPEISVHQEGRHGLHFCSGHESLKRADCGIYIDLNGDLDVLEVIKSSSLTTLLPDLFSEVAIAWLGVAS
jgi:hypothetical protein